MKRPDGRTTAGKVRRTLTPEQRAELRAIYKAQNPRVTQLELARKYKISQSTVNRLVSSDD